MTHPSPVISRLDVVGYEGNSIDGLVYVRRKPPQPSFRAGIADVPEVHAPSVCRELRSESSTVEIERRVCRRLEVLLVRVLKRQQLALRCREVNVRHLVGAALRRPRDEQQARQLVEEDEPHPAGHLVSAGRSMVDVEDDDAGDDGHGNEDTGEEKVLSDHRDDDRRAWNQFHEQKLEEAERQHDRQADGYLQ